MNFERQANGGLRLDLGCGRRKLAGSVGVDNHPCADADLRFDLDSSHWPIADDVVGAVQASHIIEHVHRIPAFLDEIHRICMKGAEIEILTPHFSCWRSYADPTHLHHLSLMAMDHFVAEDPGGRLTRGRFRLVRRRLSFDRSIKNWLPRWMAKRHPKSYERHLAFLFPGRTLTFTLEVV